MIYNFKCTECGFNVEVVQPIATASFEDRNCPRCSKITATHVFEGAPAVATSGMSNAPLDVVVGRDASARWADIARRQEIRNDVRQKSGEEAVRMTGRNQFEAIPGAQRQAVTAPNSGRDDD
jgi:putative FmdB family regulatory protein